MPKAVKRTLEFFTLDQLIGSEFGSMNSDDITKLEKLCVIAADRSTKSLFFPCDFIIDKCKMESTIEGLKDLKEEEEAEYFATTFKQEIAELKEELEEMKKFMSILENVLVSLRSAPKRAKLTDQQ
ncbi:hypothetical protein GUITHDRAFT_147757 [Guillardia theta CCMP2712]|uniref:Uncharacterized protein n=1 Tax=Guillardia theta (strain CCMP2712) TaxID=905079 RepID=L1IC03_GUITC|nr:hypothetical protein GUITHDRAFT_147757 [Guillardia theta CCMP2712]EKX33627.1 hypothetical protein GUITHDRAFT_147757 [Guillardia theta CCMP2712]|eukprot:XP_005820607.1 hypothetical protein GUITHDRAFT_147757 [Guillardia theta CCMP2712]